MANIKPTYIFFKNNVYLLSKNIDKIHIYFSVEKPTILLVSWG